jgi:hypothetical protein
MIFSCMSMLGEDCQRNRTKVWFARLFDLAITIFAILVAVRCNPTNSIGFGILAAIFPEIYLIQWSARKYVFREPGYCSGLEF